MVLGDFLEDYSLVNETFDPTFEGLLMDGIKSTLWPER